MRRKLVQNSSMWMLRWCVLDAGAGGDDPARHRTHYAGGVGKIARDDGRRGVARVVVSVLRHLRYSGCSTSTGIEVGDGVAGCRRIGCGYTDVFASLARVRIASLS